MPPDVAITLDGLSHIVTPELARDLSSELIAMLNHSRAHIRKRAILTLYKLLAKYPEAISQARVRLEEKLNDSDPGEQVGWSVIISHYICSRCSRCS
jgi:AP-3 complex subunit delta-1